MNQRIDAAAKEWAEERQRLETQVEEYRGKLAEALGRLLAAETVKARQLQAIARLRDVLEWLDRKGGLGLDVHERVRKALDDNGKGLEVHGDGETP